MDHKLENNGKDMHQLLKRLFPICRSLTGNGVRQTLGIIKEHIPISLHEVATGTKAFDWTVGKEWNIKDAYILDPHGRKIIDFKKNNLHVMGHSIPVNQKISLSDLQEHLYSLPQQPEAIPYVFSYYKERWGFCMSHRQREKLKNGQYHVLIDSSFKDGHLTYGECLIPGKSKKEIFLSTYVCHPSMANNELSGPVVLTFAAKWIMSQPRHFTYRLVFIPETLGAIVYLSRHLDQLKKKVEVGFNLSCIGDDRAYSYVASPYGNNAADRIAGNVLRFIDAANKKAYPYIERGSDERQYCSPGVDLPLVTLCRSKFATFPEYHTSLDDFNFVTPTGLWGGYNFVKKCLEAAEMNKYYRVTCLGEPQLGKRNLYPSIGGIDSKIHRQSEFEVLDILNFITYADGTNDLIAISDIIGLPLDRLYIMACRLLEEGLVCEVKKGRNVKEGHSIKGGSMKKKRMLITGLSGLLGNNLAYCLKDTYDIAGVYHAHKIGMDGVRAVYADLTSGDGLKNVIEDFNPDIIVHSAAQANVEICEEHPLEAEKINVLATKYLMKSVTNEKTKVIYISSDLVYDGVKGDFSERDDTGPLNFYGHTKCQGELESLIRRNSLVLRTNFFGWNVLEGKYSLGEWVIHELSQGNEIKGLTDCLFSSIYTFEMAGILDLAIQKELSGIYNFVSGTSLSKYEFLRQVADKLGLNRDLIKPISVDEFEFKAKRSKNLNLNVDKLATALSIDVPSIEYSIGQFVKDFKKGIPQRIQSYRSPKNIYPVSLETLPYGRQSIDDNDISAVVDVLKSGAITQGPKVNEFESALCEATDASFAVAVNSGTAALHIACLAAGIGAGDEVITSPNTFVASANCAVYCGGKPVFADIDPRTYNISPQEIQKKINSRTKAIIPVHFAGQSCDMQEIQDIVKASEKKFGRKIYIIEDASHALGSCYKTAKVGSCAYSDMATMSFHPVKHVTTGEGGVVLTKDERSYKVLKKLRSHGITSDDAELKQEKPGPWYYEQQLLGYNYRLTDIQSALGSSQLKKLPYFIQRRREIAQKYQELFKDTPHIQLPSISKEISNLHLFVLLIDFEAIAISRREFMLKLRDQGILTQVHYIPVMLHPFYKAHYPANLEDYPNEKKYYSRCLSIPLFPAMTDQDIKKSFHVINSLLS